MENREVEGEKVSIYSYLTVLVSYRRFIFLNLVGVCLIVAVISFLLPSWYRASTTILPPERETLGLGMASSLLGAASGLATSFSLPLMATPSDVMAAILESRRVGQAVAEKKNLSRSYKTKSMEETLKQLFSHLSVQVTKEGIVSLSFEDRDRTMAADVANCFVEELDRINQETSTSKAKSARIFIETRLAQTRAELSKAEDDLRTFQQDNKTILVDDQMKAVIEKAADLKAEMVSSEIELNVLSKTMSSSHPQVQSLRSRISEIKRQLEILESGNQKGNPEGKTVLDVPFSQVPSLSLQLARLIREVKIQEKVFELLTQQYEQYKIEETKDTPTVQVLDKAVPPERRAKPKRALLVGLSGLLSILASTTLVFGLEYLKRAKLRNPEGFSRLETLLGVWRKDADDLKRKLGFRRNTD
ncbi:MAG: GNVR domain-containing protein [Candidatus Zixiibacteriota bacterium]